MILLKLGASPLTNFPRQYEAPLPAPALVGVCCDGSRCIALACCWCIEFRLEVVFRRCSFVPHWRQIRFPDCSFRHCRDCTVPQFAQCGGGYISADNSEIAMRTVRREHWERWRNRGGEGKRRKYV